MRRSHPTLASRALSEYSPYKSVGHMAELVVTGGLTRFLPLLAA